MCCVHSDNKIDLKLCTFYVINVKRVVKCVSLFCIISIINEIPDPILHSNAKFDSGSKNRLPEGSHDFSSNYQEHVGTAGQESNMTVSLITRLCPLPPKIARNTKFLLFFSSRFHAKKL